MASPIVIPIIIVAVAGLATYLVYRYIVFDHLCKSKLDQILLRYNIGKTPAQIIKEFYEHKGEDISHAQIKSMERHYRQTDPEQFLIMYDEIRERERERS